METAELICMGDDQVVRLPPEFWFAGDRVHIRRLGTVIILAPSDEPWRALRDGLDLFTEDFMADRSQERGEVREAVFHLPARSEDNSP
jgi:antitoxin VapB